MRYENRSIIHMNIRHRIIFETIIIIAQMYKCKRTYSRLKKKTFRFDYKHLVRQRAWKNNYWKKWDFIVYKYYVKCIFFFLVLEIELENTYVTVLYIKQTESLQKIVA